MGWFDNPIGELSDAVQHASDVVSSGIKWDPSKDLDTGWQDLSKNGLNAKPSNVFAMFGDNLGAGLKKWESRNPTASKIGPAIAGWYGGPIAGRAAAHSNALERGDSRDDPDEVKWGSYGATAGNLWGGGDTGSDSGYSTSSDSPSWESDWEASPGYDSGGYTPYESDWTSAADGGGSVPWEVDWNSPEVASTQAGYDNAAQVAASSNNIESGLDQAPMADEAASSVTTSPLWSKLTGAGTKVATDMGKQYVGKQLNKSEAGRALNMGYGLYNGTPGINGNDSGGGGNWDWGNTAKTLVGLYGNQQASDAIDRQRQGMQQDLERSRSQYNSMPTLESMYGANSPYALQLKQSLARRDAKAGRNSQYGPREAQYQAMLADKGSQYANTQANAAENYNRANSATSKNISDLEARQRAIQNAQLGSLWNMGQQSGAFSGLGSLFGGGGNGYDSSNYSPFESGWE